MTDKMEPCPFCGSDDLKVFGESAPEWWVTCISCRAGGQCRSTRQQAIEDWNRRAAPSPGMPSDERAAFEAWALEHLQGASYVLHRRDMRGSDRFGEYVSPLTETAWEAWQARAALRSPEDQGEKGWISVDERLPDPGVAVLAFFRNKYDHARTVRAHHAPKHTIEASHWDEDAETDDNEDGSFEPEGWYEDPAVGETLAFISETYDGKVTHWQPLPTHPAIDSTKGGSHG